MFNYQDMVTKSANTVLTGQRGHMLTALGEAALALGGMGSGSVIHAMRAPDIDYHTLKQVMGKETSGFQAALDHVRSHGVKVYEDHHDMLKQLSAEGHKAEHIDDMVNFFHGTGPHFKAPSTHPGMERVKDAIPHNHPLHQAHIYLDGSRNEEVLKHEFGHYLQSKDPNYSYTHPGVISTVFNPHSDPRYHMEQDAWNRVNIHNSGLRDTALSTYHHSAAANQSNALGTLVNLGIAGGTYHMLKKKPLPPPTLMGRIRNTFHNGLQSLQNSKPEHILLGGVGTGVAAAGTGIYQKREKQRKS